MRAAGIPGARGHRLRRRLSQSDRRLLAGAPIRCARLGRGLAAGRGWVRVDPTAAVAPERIYDTLDDRAARAAAACSACAARRCAMPATGCGAAGTTSCSASMPTPAARLLQPLGIDDIDAGTPGRCCSSLVAALALLLDGVADRARRARARPGAARLASPRRALRPARARPRAARAGAATGPHGCIARAPAAGAALDARSARVSPNGATLARPGTSATRRPGPRPARASPVTSSALVCIDSTIHWRHAP